MRVSIQREYIFVADAVKKCRFNRNKIIILKKVVSMCMILVLLFDTKVSAEENDTVQEYDIYAQAAIMMDAASGRILFEKNADEKLAIASTTKILTCILILENGKMDDYLQISKNAASQPEVNGDLREGEYYQVGDLVYSMMLESHNDAAVALAEYLDQTVEAFAERMNQKAKLIGCENYYFITPNGLDAENKNGMENGASARDLVRILQYCVVESRQKEKFLEVTSAKEHSFHNYLIDSETNGIRAGTRNFYVANKNAYLSMREGVISGKTGYTSKAGYCYVCAVKRDQRIFLVALLGSGWPPKKNCKWKDCNTLYDHGFGMYEYKSIQVGIGNLPDVQVIDGIPGKDSFEELASVSIVMEPEMIDYVMTKEEYVQSKLELNETLKAPVSREDVVGKMRYYVGNELIKEVLIHPAEDVKKKEKDWFLETTWKFFLQTIL